MVHFNAGSPRMSRFMMGLNLLKKVQFKMFSFFGGFEG